MKSLLNKELNPHLSPLDRFRLALTLVGVYVLGLCIIGLVVVPLVWLITKLF